MQKFAVQESPELLRRLLRHYDGMKEYARVRMLILFREKPFLSNRLVAKELEIPESTMRRWKSLYTEQGLQALLGIGEEETKHFHDLLASLRVAEPYSTTTPAKLLNLLNNLPIKADTAVWNADIRNLLIATFDDIDYALVNVRIVLDLLNSDDMPEPDPADANMSVYRLDVFEKGSYVPSFRREVKIGQPRWKVLLAEGRRRGFPFDTYHPPIGFDYFIRKNVFIGCIVLLREKKKPPISDETLKLFEGCRQFISNTIFHHVLFRQFKHPGIQLYNSIGTYIEADPPLTTRESEVLRLLMLGHTYEEAAELLYITRGTMISHVRNIYRKTGVTKLSELFARIFTPWVTPQKTDEGKKKE